MADLKIMQVELAERRSENTLLVARNKKLASEVMALKTNAAAVEQKARMELGMVKDNETFYRVIEEKPGSTER